MFIIDNKFKKIQKILKLDKPLVIFDVETTGQNISTDKIVEIYYTKILENGATKEEDLIINPEIPISPEAIAVHAISDNMVADKPTFRDVSQTLWEVFNDCYYGGFNIVNFDLPVLRREFIRIGMDFEYRKDRIIDTREIFRYFVPRTLPSAYEYYCGKELKLGHTAPLNTQVATDILLSQLGKYKEIRDLEFIKKIYDRSKEEYLDKAGRFYWQRGQAYFAFSKYKNRSLSRVVKEDPAFLKWILEADFSDETKDIVRKALDGNVPIKEADGQKK